MAHLVEGMGFEVVPVTASATLLVAQCYDRRGRGIHPAGLNLGDCFAYVVAQQHGCSLLYVREDFGRTDVESIK